MAISYISCDPAFLELFDPQQDYIKIADGLTLGEGPFWDPILDCFIFNDVPASKTYSYNEKDGIKVLFDNEFKANGSCLNLDGRWLGCEHWTSFVSARNLPGGEAREVLASKYGGTELNSPNDIVVRSDGLIYFTDPIYGRGIKPACNPRPIPSDRRPVYMYDPSKKSLILVVDGFENPNGLCFSPDERILYVNDSGRYEVKAYDVNPDGTLSNERLLLVTEGEGGPPDGMKCDEYGNIVIAAQQGLHWVSPEGNYLGVIIQPERLLNFTFGGSDMKTVLICCQTGAYIFRSKAAGTILPPIKKNLWK